MNLTPRQIAVVDAIRSHGAKYGYPPTREELAKALGITQQGATGHLHALERKGVLAVDTATARGVRILPAVVAEVQSL